LDDSIFGEIINKKNAHEIWIYLNEKYGMVSNDKDGEHKEEVYENVKHDHNLVIVEDCSSSWPSDADIDERSTTSSLDKIDGSISSDANHCYIPRTIYNCDCSYSNDYAIASIYFVLHEELHCLMSQGNKRVSSCNVIGHDSYDELVSRLASMNIALENEMAKTSKLENENSFIKNTCEQQKHLLYVITCSHEELKMAHDELSVTHDNLVQDHAFLTKELSNEKTKTSKSSSLWSHDQSHDVANLCDVGKLHVSTSCDDLLYMPCFSQIDSCSTSIYCETNILKENNELKNEVKNLSNKLESKSKGKNKNMCKKKRFLTSCAIGAMIWDILQSIAQPRGLKLSQKKNPKIEFKSTIKKVIWG
jgi:hypothetical protein